MAFNFYNKQVLRITTCLPCAINICIISKPTILCSLVSEKENLKQFLLPEVLYSDSFVYISLKGHCTDDYTFV